MSKLVLGNLYALLAFFCMAFMGVFTKVASANSSAIWVSFFTYFAGAIVMIGIISFDGIKTLKTKRFPEHFFRAFIGLSASFLYLLAMQKIPIVNATLLFNTSPLFIPIIATLWLGVTVSKKNWLAIILGFIGIIFIIKPTLDIFKHVGSLYGLFSGLALAIAYLLVKLLSSTEPPKRILFYFFVIATILQVPFLTMAGSLIEFRDILFACSAGLSLLFAQLFLIKAYQLASASQVGVYQYTSVVFVGLIDWLVWGFVPPLSELFGVVLVIIAGAIIIRGSGTMSLDPKKANF